MSWAHFIMLLCTIRLSQCSVCKLEIIPTSQNLWSWPYPHLHTYTLSVIHKPSSFYGYRFKITRDKIGKCFYQATSAFSLAAIILSKTKQNPQYLLSPWRGVDKGEQYSRKKCEWLPQRLFIQTHLCMFGIYISANKNDGTTPEQWHIIFKSFTNIKV